MKKKIVVASGNHAKIKEIQAILSDFEISVFIKSRAVFFYFKV